MWRVNLWSNFGSRGCTLSVSDHGSVRYLRAESIPFSMHKTLSPRCNASGCFEEIAVLEVYLVFPPSQYFPRQTRVWKGNAD